MNTVEKLKVLGSAAKYDTCASSASNRAPKGANRIGNASNCGICHSFTPDGRCISLLKVLYSNACSFDCKYCANRSGCKKRVAKFTPEELAKTFMSMYLRNYVEGVFLSSGIMANPDKTTEQMLETVHLLRNKYKFQGYIHFKTLPGTGYDHIKQASEISDRLSINLEAPNKSRLSEISTVKDFKIDILRRQAWIKRMRVPSGQTTQLVVGSSDESDHELLSMINWEYDNIKLKRAYYSAFIPVRGTPLENKKRESLDREHRLYNVDFMLRKYGIKYQEFKGIMDDGFLPKGDPKLHLARATLDDPVDINESSFDQLIRVPGIGPISAQRLLSLQRKNKKIKKYEQLHSMGIVLKRAMPFINVDGKHQTRLSAF